MPRSPDSVEGLTVPKGVRNSVGKAGGFRKVRSGIPRSDKLSMEAKRHNALSDSTRLQIVHSLATADLCPCLLKKITKTTDSRLSYHLKILEDARFIKVTRTKNWRIYSITKSGKNALKWPSR